MIYYSEPKKRRENRRGKLRTYFDLAELATGTAWNEDRTVRYFRSEEALAELPDDVVEVREDVVLAAIAENKAEFEARPEPVPTQRDLDLDRLRELRQKKIDGETLTREELDEITLLKL